MALEVSNEPGSNPHELTDDQIRVAIVDGRLNRHPAGQAITGFQAYESWGYTFHTSNPRSFLTMLVFVIYTETPSDDRFVHYARRATREEESERG